MKKLIVSAIALLFTVSVFAAGETTAPAATGQAAPVKTTMSAKSGQKRIKKVKKVKKAAAVATPVAATTPAVK